MGPRDVPRPDRSSGSRPRGRRPDVPRRRRRRHVLRRHARQRGHDRPGAPRWSRREGRCPVDARLGKSGHVGRLREDPDCVRSDGVCDRCRRDTLRTGVVGRRFPNSRRHRGSDLRSLVWTRRRSRHLGRARSRGRWFRRRTGISDPPAALREGLRRSGVRHQYRCRVRHPRDPPGPRRRHGPARPRGQRLLFPRHGRWHVGHERPGRGHAFRDDRRRG